MTPERPIHTTRDETASGGRGDLIAADAEACRECWSCARLCPAKAIKVSEGRPEVVAERCVSCGLCVMECSSGGFRVRSDTASVRALLGGVRPVVAVLATEFVTALHPLVPFEVERRLETLGFHAVESTLLGEEMVAQAYEQLMARRNGLPLLRSTCPVVVSWVRKYRPALSGALAPLVPPYVAQARLVRELYPDEVAVVYVGPCFARKDEALDPQFAGAVDAVLDFVELGSMMEDAASVERSASAGANRPAPLKEISLTDGFPRLPLEERTMTATDVHVARGLRETDRILHAIEGGEAAPEIVDLLNCEGCIDGPAVNSGMSVFAKRNIDMAEREARGTGSVSNRELLRYLPRVDLVRTVAPDPVDSPETTDEDVDRVLAEGGFVSREETIDCGACGYPTCVAFAAAVHQALASWEMCFPFQRSRLHKDIEDLATSATIDPVTGLWNRGALTERLDDEISRYHRYGTPVSLLMMDLDTFKRVNDDHGHLVGDQLLGAVGHLLLDDMRTSDFSARYGGDEFAVVLPGTTKTEAYAVAEKVRLSIAALRVSPRGAQGDSPVGTTASIGIASAGGDVADGVGLLDAADRALYAAKEGGRDQVRLAPQ